MTGAGAVRAAVIGLVSFAAAEEQMLLAAAGPADAAGSPQRWAAAPVVAHITEFKRQQVRRLRAIGDGEPPPQFAEIDHGSAAVYEGYQKQPAGAVAEASRQAAQALIAGLAATPDEDLLEPGRHPWLKGRQLWLQIVVRGFWHPTGHLGDYYIARGRAARAIALHEQAVAHAAYLDAPGPARGMACYTLACSYAQASRAADALDMLTEAVALNPDLRASAARDADLRPLREAGRLDVLLR
jgi:tetratricopeptide (TPR) repeat protein